MASEIKDSYTLNLSREEAEGVYKALNFAIGCSRDTPDVQQTMYFYYLKGRVSGYLEVMEFVDGN